MVGVWPQLVTRRLEIQEWCRDARRDGTAASKVRVPLAATHYVYGARALRDFGDGYVAVLLPVYLTALGLGVFEVGVVATLALLGSATMTLAMGYAGSRIDQRTLLMLSAGLMAVTGLAFASASTYAVILL